MKRRKIGKAIKRLRHLPTGIGFFRYALNKSNSALLKLTKSTRVAHPSTLMLEVTNHCNLHCITCPREYQYGKEMDLGHMDIELLKRTVNQAYPYIDSIGLTGMGEPLFYKHLAEALSFIKGKSKGIITSISTNATLPNTIDKINEIKEHIDTIQISIDGIGDTYNKIRKNADFDKFIENVKKIREITAPYNTDITLNMVVIKENYHQMSDLIDLTNELHLNNLTYTFFNLASITEQDISYYDLYYSEDFLKEFNKTTNKIKLFPNIDIDYWDYHSENGFQKCPFPWTHFYVSWDGYMPPCCAKPFPKELSFGDLQQTTLFDCLNSDEYRKFRTLWYKNHTPDFCKKCHFTDLKPIRL